MKSITVSQVDLVEAAHQLVVHYTQIVIYGLIEYDVHELLALGVLAARELLDAVRVNTVQ